ncbi:hypothetical protein DSO57_1031040 [Entomophthora muscae]|uniref:Uncharacterized protein n=1 Tax=Entomophthora muscae TaxID=34485 RepID=A0ACC2TNU2_9FUNG|nr:hypothetical protein DSO57_1031040 [Entomophthora muscae]
MSLEVKACTGKVLHGRRVCTWEGNPLISSTKRCGLENDKYTKADNPTHKPGMVKHKSSRADGQEEETTSTRGAFNGKGVSVLKRRPKTKKGMIKESLLSIVFTFKTKRKPGATKTKTVKHSLLQSPPICSLGPSWCT